MMDDSALPRFADIGEDGRVSIPGDLQASLGLKPGMRVTLDVVGDTMHIRAARTGLARARAILRKYVPADVSLADELIADRRASAARE